MTIKKEEWVEILHLAEPALLTACNYFCIPTDKRRLRTHFATIRGLAMDIVLDFKENQWIAASIWGIPNTTITNPESLYLKENHEKNTSS